MKCVNCFKSILELLKLIYIKTDKFDQMPPYFTSVSTGTG